MPVFNPHALPLGSTWGCTRSVEIASSVKALWFLVDAAFNFVEAMRAWLEKL
jgi:hypothetical protein